LIHRLRAGSWRQSKNFRVIHVHRDALNCREAKVDGVFASEIGEWFTRWTMGQKSLILLRFGIEAMCIGDFSESGNRMSRWAAAES